MIDTEYLNHNGGGGGGGGGEGSEDYCVHNSIQACSHEQSELSCIFVCLLPTIVWCVYLMSWFSFFFLLLALIAPWVESPNQILKPGNILAQLQFAQNTKA